MTPRQLNWDEYVERVHAIREGEVGRHPNGIQNADLNKLVAITIEADVRAGDIILPGRVVLDEVSAMAARADRKAARRNPELLRRVEDCVNGLTILGKSDPIMDTLAVCGAGVRKAWRYTTVADLNAMIVEKNTHAAAAAAAALVFATTATAVVTEMAARSATYLEDILP